MAEDALKTVDESLSWAEEVLKGAGLKGGLRQEARLLLADVLGVPFEMLLARPERSLAEAEVASFQEKVRRRSQREPVSRILGHREFWSLSFRLSPGTLDPRPDSETLIEAVLSLCPDQKRSLRILDLGTGSGCLLISLLSEYPQAEGVGVDQNESALLTAQENARDLGVADRVIFLKSDWGVEIHQKNLPKFDIVISNPPYIPTADIPDLAPEVSNYDPLDALDGGADGLMGYRRLAQEIPELLAPEGRVVLEIGQGQDPAVQGIFEAVGFSCDKWVPDLSGVSRCGIFYKGDRGKGSP